MSSPTLPSMATEKTEKSGATKEPEARSAPHAANDVSLPDPYVERALAAMRSDPARTWTVAALAKVAGLSRAPFARRFRESTGISPLRWLREHRLGLAKERLVEESDLALAEIAVDIGYATEFAFAKAFKRLFGLAPGTYRRRVILMQRRASLVSTIRACFGAGPILAIRWGRPQTPIAA